jgi:hypothetical protein
MKRIVVAVVVAYLANALLIAATEQVLVHVFSGTKYLIVDVVTQSLIQVGCGYLCARISNSTTALVALILLGLVVGVLSGIATWHADPHWYAIALLAAYAPCVWIGFHLGIE